MQLTGWCLAAPLFFTSFVCSTTISESLDPRCGSLHIRPCDVKNSGRVRPGFTCETTVGKSCLDRQAWCNLGRSYMVNEHCVHSENLMFDKCLSIDKIIDGVRYHVNVAEVDWTVAEQYCQSNGMNLVSFQGQKEYDKVIHFLRTVSENSKDIFIWHDIDYRDQLAQRCWAVHDTIQQFWTGLYFDRNTRQWNYSDGNVINKAIRAGSVKLEDALWRYTSSVHTGYVSIVDRDFDFILDKIHDGHRRIDAVSNRAKILCKDDKNLKWSGGLKQQNAGCITGFKCFEKEKCITGVGFENSDVCNGRLDCYHGEDESSFYCETFKANFPDMSRTALFTPLRRTVTAAKAICNRPNLTMPSIQGEKDIQFLKHLPIMFANSRTSPDFFLSSESWHNLDFTIPLGIRRDSNVWSDGSAINFLSHEISDLPSNSELYMVFNSSMKGNVVALHEPPLTVFPVCQAQLGYQVFPIPVVIQVKSTAANQAPKPNIWSRMPMMIFALYTIR